MGYYIPGPNKGKTDYIVENHHAERIRPNEAKQAMDDGFAVIVVVDNIIFDAAVYCYSHNELKEFSDPEDYRPKHFLKMNKKLAEELSSYKP